MANDKLSVKKILDEFEKNEQSATTRKGSSKIDASFEEAMKSILKAKPEPKKKKTKGQ